MEEPCDDNIVTGDHASSQNEGNGINEDGNIVVIVGVVNCVSVEVQDTGGGQPFGNNGLIGHMVCEGGQRLAEA